MQKMKTIILLIVSSFTGLIFSCKKTDHFVDANVKNGESFYPVSGSIWTDLKNGGNINGHYYGAGDTLIFELQYYSQDSLNHIDFLAANNNKTDTLKNIPYQSSFYSTIQQADTTLLQYIVPSTVKPGDKITLSAVWFTNTHLTITQSAVINIR